MMEEQQPKVCSLCGTAREDLHQCSKCKQRYYCNVDCQRLDWPTHKRLCKSLNQSRRVECTTQSVSLNRCPYRPDGVSSTSGVCPFRDMEEESQLQEIISKDLAKGLEGMLELGGLARSPEMSMQIPLQKAVGKVLKVLEKMDLSDNEVTIDYLNSIGTFISNMLQWEHNEFIKQEKYDRLISSALRVILQRGVDCAFVFGKILFWLYGYDRQRFEGYMKSFLTSDAVFVVESICKAPIHEDWQTSQRSILWGSFVSRLREVVIL